MNKLPLIVLVAFFAPATYSAATDNVNEWKQDQVQINTSEEVLRSPDLARCQGTKCAGPGDWIRHQEGLHDAQQLAGSRGGEATSGGKKGARHYENPAMPLLAGSRGGEATSGGKKGARHYDSTPSNSCA